MKILRILLVLAAACVLVVGATSPWYTTSDEYGGKVSQNLAACNFHSNTARNDIGKEGFIVRDSWKMTQPEDPTKCYPHPGGFRNAYKKHPFSKEGYTHVEPYEFIAEVIAFEVKPCAGHTDDPNPPSAQFNQLGEPWGSIKMNSVKTPKGKNHYIGNFGCGVLAFQNCFQSMGVKVAGGYPEPGMFCFLFIFMSPFL